MPAESVRLPAEWEEQAALQLTWPHSGNDWGRQLEAAESVLLELAQQVSRHQPLLIACHDRPCRIRVAKLFRRSGIEADRYSLYQVPSNDIWTRDHGPLTVYRNGSAELLDFRFNGWGGRFPAEQDNALSMRLHAAGAYGQTPMRSIALELEGGAIDTDGAGTLLTTTGALLRNGRDSAAQRRHLEEKLGPLLGCRRILWLRQNGLPGDDTGGHIDLLARFTSPERLVYTAARQGQDAPAALTALVTELKALRRPDAGRYDLIPLPRPHRRELDPHPASYTNFLIVNGSVLIPQYGDRTTDREALELLAPCFPGRCCVGIDCRPLIRQGGALHCAAMQLPAGGLQNMDGKAA